MRKVAIHPLNIHDAGTSDLTLALRSSEGSGRILHYANDALPEILAAVQAGNRVGRLLHAFENIFAVPNQSGSDPFGERTQPLRISVRVVEYQKTLHPCSFHQKVSFDPRTDRWWVPCRDRCRAADDHAGADGQVPEDGVAYLAGSIVEVHVDTVRAGFRNRRIELSGAIVNGGVVSEFLSTEFDLLGSAGDANGATPLDPCDLPNARADRAGSS